MVLKPNPIHIDDRFLTAFLDRLRDIFRAMDREYTRATEHYQFQCDGCMDNCCLTRFYHHTHLEFYYLRMGFENLGSRKNSKDYDEFTTTMDDLIENPEFLKNTGVINSNFVKENKGASVQIMTHIRRLL